MAEKTAVEWLEEVLQRNNGKEFIEMNKSIFKHAKEAERLQIINCFAESSMAGCVAIGLEVGPKDLKDFEEIGAVYYEETFKSE
jgi:hypothetical protein